MKLRELGTVCGVIASIISGDVPNLRIARRVGDVNLPPEWEDRFRRCNKVLQATENEAVSAYIDEDEIESRYGDLVHPNDIVAVVLVDGDDEVADRLVSSVNDGAVVREVIGAVRGELAALFEV